MKLNLIDIGALGGLEYPWRRNSELVGTVLSFEPNDEPVISDHRIVYNTAVWNYDGIAEFTVSGRRGSGSSLLKQNFGWVEEHFDEIKDQGNRRLNRTWFARSQPTRTFPCEVRRLDAILADIPNRPRFHFLKSDTQSGEWFVLDGAREFLRTECLGAELECFRYPLYEGLKTEDEVFALMDELGFDRWGWTGYKNSFLSQADYLFLKRDVRSEDRASLEAIKSLYRTDGPASKIKQEPILEQIGYKLAARLGLG